jgi:hypothetical protein
MLEDHQTNTLLARVIVLEKKVEHLEELLTHKIANIFNQLVASTQGVSDIAGSSGASGATA